MATVFNDLHMTSSCRTAAKLLRKGKLWNGMQKATAKQKTENWKLKTKDSGQRDGKQVNKITKSKMKQNETKLNRKLQLAVGSHRQSNDLQLCANLFASSPRCRLHLPRSRPLLVSAAPSRRTRAHHNSERDSCPRQRHLNVATLSARGGHEGRATFWWRWDLSGITRSYPCPALPRLIGRSFRIRRRFDVDEVINNSTARCRG